MWYRPDGELSAEAIAEDFSTQLTDGIASRAAPDPKAVRRPAKTLRAQKRDATPR
jgi:hypothetical protein